MKVYLVQQEVDLGSHTLKVFYNEEDALKFSEEVDKKISESVWCGFVREKVIYKKYTFVEDFEVE